MIGRQRAMAMRMVLLVGVVACFLGGQGALCGAPADAPEWQATMAEAATGEDTSGENVPRIHVGLGQRMSIDGLAMSPDGQLLASGDAGGTVRLWDVRTGRDVRVIRTQTRSVLGISFGPKGKLLATGSSDGRVVLWNVLTATQVRTMKGHSGMLFGVCFSPDGKLLATGGVGELIRLWDVATGQQVRTLKGHLQLVRALCFSGDGRVLASGGYDNMVRLWDVRTGAELHTLKGHSDEITSLCLSPDGQLLASGSYVMIKLWRVKTGEEVRTWRGHDGSVDSLSFSPDGRILVSGSGDGTAKFWDVATGGEIRVLPRRGPRRMPAPIRAVVFTPDGKFVVTAGGWDNVILLWDVATGRENWAFAGHTAAVASVCFSPDGALLASGGWDNAIRLWDVKTRANVHTIEENVHQVQFVCFSPDGKLLASGDLDPHVMEEGGEPAGFLRLWDMATAQEVRTLKGHALLSLAGTFSPDGSLFATGGLDAGSPDGTALEGWVRLWDVKTGREVRTLKGHKHVPSSVAISPDGKLLASAAGDATVRLWEVATGREISAMGDHLDWVRCVRFSPNGRFLITGSLNGSIRFRDARDGSLLATMAAVGIDGDYVAWTPEGYFTATPKGEERVSIIIGNRALPLGKYRDVYYRPDLVAKKLAGEKIEPPE